MGSKNWRMVIGISNFHLIHHEFLQLSSHYSTNKDEKPFPCKYCTKQFNDHSSWKRHEQVHINKGHIPTNEESEMVYFCKFCSKDFLGPENLKIHEELHKTGELLICKICNKLCNIKTNGNFTSINLLL